MVKLNKRPVPPEPINSDNDYRSEPNFSALSEDCSGKCYLCENKAATLNVEHLISHRGDPLLKYDWQNLFLSCGHCNNTKLTSYDGILNPVKCDPEDYITLSLTVDSLVEEVSVAVLPKGENNKAALLTAELLKRIYNEGTTAIKKVECTNLRNAVSDCIARFLQVIKGYKEEPDIGYDAIIEKEISRSAAFAAFKRKIICDDAELSIKFSASLL